MQMWVKQYIRLSEDVNSTARLDPVLKKIEKNVTGWLELLDNYSPYEQNMKVWAGTGFEQQYLNPST